MASHSLVVSNLDLVDRLARKLGITRRSRVWDDAIQAGRVGLLIAAERFDSGKGASFGTYARFWVLKWIRLELDSERVVASPRGEAATVLSTESYSTPQLTDDSDGEDSMLEGIHQRRRVAELRAAVRELPAESRRAIQAVCSGSTVAEYARRKGVPARTAFDHFAAGRGALRAYAELS